MLKAELEALGVPSMVEPLERVLLAHPRDVFRTQTRIDEQWESLGFIQRPQLEESIAEFEELCSTLTAESVEVVLIDQPGDVTLDALYIRDSSLITPDGRVILCRMGKESRRNEPGWVRSFYEQTGSRIAGSVHAPGMLEGGDVVWLDSRTVVVGLGYRTNSEGIEQLRTMLGDTIDELIVVQLPHFRGPADVLHLMSLISPLDDKTAVVHLPLLPSFFVSLLESKGYKLIEIDADEYDSLACNILSLGNGACLIASGNPRTAARLSQAGFRVIEFRADNICLAGCGGPTCLTRPLRRTVT